MLTIGFTLPPGFQTMGLAAASAFELANVVADESLYGIRLLAFVLILAECGPLGLAALPAKRQTLLFSATMPAEVLKLTQEFLREPKYVQVGRRGGPAMGCPV